MAYINHDIDDALRGGILALKDFPLEITRLGASPSERINAMVTDMIKFWPANRQIGFSPGMDSVIEKLRLFMFDRVYIGSDAKREESRAKHVIEALFHYFSENPFSLPQEFKGDDPLQNAADYVAGMTDRYAINFYQELFVPHPWK